MSGISIKKIMKAYFSSIYEVLSSWWEIIVIWWNIALLYRHKILLKRKANKNFVVTFTPSSFPYKMLIILLLEYFFLMFQNLWHKFFFVMDTYVIINAIVINFYKMCLSIYKLTGSLYPMLISSFYACHLLYCCC